MMDWFLKASLPSKLTEPLLAALDANYVPSATHLPWQQDPLALLLISLCIFLATFAYLNNERPAEQLIQRLYEQQAHEYNFMASEEGEASRMDLAHAYALMGKTELSEALLRSATGKVEPTGAKTALSEHR